MWLVQSEATDLVAGDANGHCKDVFLRDVLAGTTVRVSVDAEGGDPDGLSSLPTISADGRYVAFKSYATDLVANDGNGSDVFVRDLVRGTTVRASVNTEGGDGNSWSDYPSISANGRYVVFGSAATNLILNDGTGSTRTSSSGISSPGPPSLPPWIRMGRMKNNQATGAPTSADGRFVAFQSWASDLVEGDHNNQMDMFVRDLAAGTTVRASVDTEGGDPNGTSSDPSISADGRYVAFHSYSSDLVEGDRNETYDVFVRDLVTETTIRASADTEGGDVHAQSLFPQISTNGRYVAFQSLSSSLVPGDDNEARDVFVRDLLTGVTTRVSVDTEGDDANEASCCPGISADGTYVTFTSWADESQPGLQGTLSTGRVHRPVGLGGALPEGVSVSSDIAEPSPPARLLSLGNVGGVDTPSEEECVQHPPCSSPGFPADSWAGVVLGSLAT